MSKTRTLCVPGGAYAVIEGDGWELSIRVPDGYTTRQALERHADECRKRARQLETEARRCLAGIPRATSV
jgi:hypothetical protein